MDSDGDGRISRTEAAGDETMTGGFARADSNGDGYVDNQEYSRSRSSSSDTTTPQSSPRQ